MSSTTTTTPTHPPPSTTTAATATTTTTSRPTRAETPTRIRPRAQSPAPIRNQQQQRAPSPSIIRNNNKTTTHTITNNLRPCSPIGIRTRAGTGQKGTTGIDIPKETKTDDIFSRLSNSHPHHDSLIQLRMARDENELKECTFKPTISKPPRKSLDRKDKERAALENLPVHDRLYQDANIRRKSLDANNNNSSPPTKEETNWLKTIQKSASKNTPSTGTTNNNNNTSIIAEGQ
jgi:hypothetical protein